MYRWSGFFFILRLPLLNNGISCHKVAFEFYVVPCCLLVLMPAPLASCSEIPFLWLLSTGYHILSWSPWSIWSLGFWEWEIRIESHSSMSCCPVWVAVSAHLLKMSLLQCVLLASLSKKKKAADCGSLGLSVGPQFYSINQYVCFDDNTMLFIWL